MALAVQALTANTKDTSAATNTITISGIGGIVSGNVVACEVYFGAGGSTPTLSATSPATGWTKVQEHVVTSNQAAATFVRIASGTETSYTFQASGGFVAGWGVSVSAYSGGQLPVDISTFATGTASPLTTPSETTTVASDWEYVAHTTWNSPMTFNAITGFTKRTDNAGANCPTVQYDTNGTVSTGLQSATSLTAATPAGWTGHRLAISPSATTVPYIIPRDPLITLRKM